jgi:hypothetical protein
MDEAREFIHVAVMDYAPQTMFVKETKFWPKIEEAIRRGEKKKK